MQPKLIAASVAAALAGISAPLHAGPLDIFGGGEVKTMAYVSLPFGGGSRAQTAPILGFAVNHTLREQGDGFSYHPALFQQTPASAVRSLMDVRFNTQKQNWDRFRVGGMDALTYTTRMKVDGTTAVEATGISTGAIVAGVVVGVVAVAIHRDEQDRKDSQSTSTSTTAAPAEVVCPAGSTFNGRECVLTI